MWRELELMKSFSYFGMRFSAFACQSWLVDSALCVSDPDFPSTKRIIKGVGIEKEQKCDTENTGQVADECRHVALSWADQKRQKPALTLTFSKAGFVALPISSPFI